MVDDRRDVARAPARESLRERRRRARRRALAVYALALLTLYGGAWHLAHHPRFAVAAVVVDGNAVRDDGEVAAAVQSAMASAALSLAPMTNAYLARTGRIEAALEESLPEVASASVERRDRDLVVTIEERARFGYWCRSVSDSTNAWPVISGRTATNDRPGEECFALDADGAIFAREDAPEGATRFGGLVAAADPVRARYAPEATWSNLRAVLDASRAAGFSPERVSSADGVDFRIELAEGPYLLIDASHPGAQAVENLALALDDGTLAALRGYDYADLRLPHKVFLRQRVAEEPAEPAAPQE